MEKKYRTNCQTESRLLVQVETAAAVSTLGDKVSHGNAMLVEGEESGPSPTHGEQGEQTGRIQLKNFLFFHNGIERSYHLLMFAVFSQPV